MATAKPVDIAPGVASSSTSIPAPTPVPDKYRGAVVEDLQLPPAFALPQSEPISRVIELAYERDFSCIPVLASKNRKPLGYVQVANLKQMWEAGEADPTTPVSTHMTKFKRSSKHPYTLITPLTPLNELEVFLKENIFALVTDSERKFVLAVATLQDLENFVTRRG
ncbi:cystathionine beta-synthase (beta-thionase) [Moniliophthora roreri MCA 2997]|uniref:Cystathionine beta-synthase (Beta-thionase) n=2 Tax=Moniliophthora roreri TaxID=221103 RepID=V2X966_MONRO|nr:cystathionine beta-synthase (beta-thionase) [Moniliophthora roreri MCA 2997]